MLLKGPAPPPIASGWQGIRAPSSRLTPPLGARREAMESTTWIVELFLSPVFCCAPPLFSMLQATVDRITCMLGTSGTFTATKFEGKPGRGGHGDSSSPIRCPSRPKDPVQYHLWETKTPDVHGQAKRNCRQEMRGDGHGEPVDTAEVSINQCWPT